VKWLDRIREKNSKSPPMPLPKLTEASSVSKEEGSVSSVSVPRGHDESFGGPQPLSRKPPPPNINSEPCPACGSLQRWRWLDGRLLYRACLIAGDAPAVAVKVHSELLGEALWVVADGLPREQWPTDAPAYTQAEVRLLRQVGPDALAWVHASKGMFGATVVKARQRHAQSKGPTP